jgi:hypothetical protein
MATMRKRWPRAAANHRDRAIMEASEALHYIRDAIRKIKSGTRPTTEDILAILADDACHYSAIIEALRDAREVEL